MPVISTRYSATTTGNSYLSPSVGTYRSTLSATNRSSSDRATSIERPNYTSATESYLNRSRASSSTFRLSTSSNYRLTNGSSSNNSTNDSLSSRYGTQHHRSSSLARTVAISGLELYEKYSPANYTPKSELIRSSSLSDSNSSSLQHSITTTSVNNNKEPSPIVGLNKVIKASSANGTKNVCCESNNKSNIIKKNKPCINNNHKTHLCHHHHCNNHHPSSAPALSTTLSNNSEIINNDSLSSSTNNNNNNDHNAKNIQDQSLRHNTRNKSATTHSLIIQQTHKKHQNQNKTIQLNDLQKQNSHDLKNIETGNAGPTNSSNFDHRHIYNSRSSSCSSTCRRQLSNSSLNNNSNTIMPSYNLSTAIQGSLNYKTEQNKSKFCMNLTPSNTLNNKKTTTSIFNGNPNKRASFLPVHGSTSSINTIYCDENFLKKEYELARNQVIRKNLKNDEDHDSNNNMNTPLINSKGAMKSINDEKHELNEVRNKILSKVALKNANNMMVHSELLLNGTKENSSENLSDDIKFIDSDSDNLSDKRTSPLNDEGNFLNSNIAAAPNHVTKMLATSTPVHSNNLMAATTLTRNTINKSETFNKTNTYPPKPTKSNIIIPLQNSVISPNNKKLIVNASPKNSCVYDKQQEKQNLRQTLSVNKNSDADMGKLQMETMASSGSQKATVSLSSPCINSTTRTTRIRVITSTDTDNEDESTNVSTSATIILPSKKHNALKSSSLPGDGKNIAHNHDMDNKDAPTIVLEKKNIINQKKISDYNDSSVRSTSSLRSALPPTSSLSSRSNWDKDSYRSTYSSRNYDNDSSASTSSYTLPRSSFSSRSGSPGKDYVDSRKTEKETSEGLCGLWNIGNTCFMNSVLQCLSNTKELTRGIKALVPVRSSGKDQRIFTEFQKLIKELWTPGNRSVNPSEFKMAFSSKHRMYSGSAQQDSQEFLRFFLDSVHGALNTATKAEPITLEDSMSDSRKAELMWNWYSKTENSVIKDLFVGQLKSTLKCTECGNTSTTFDPFWDLSVSLPSNTRCKLSDCLDLFIKEEVLDGEEMPTCSKCKTRRKCTKSFTIQHFPKILVIHLKRFSETRWSKLTTLVEFPTSEGGLNLGPYASCSNTDSNNGLYSLYATSNHMGSTAGGHYVAFCKHPITKKWHEFNDNSVTDAPESSLVSSSAYLLFYEKM